MRYIKFRALAYGNWWYSDDEAYVLKEINGKLCLCEDIKFYSENNEYELKVIGEACQYTGLTDKAGVEIYEGDVVKGVGSDHKGQSEVFFDLGRYQPFSYLGTYCGSEFEVIGNIYQNADLLTEK